MYRSIAFRNMKRVKFIIAIMAVAAVFGVSTCKKYNPTTPVITITSQPATTTNVTEGSISGSLSVTADVTEGATLNYKWYSAASADKTGRSAISGEKGEMFTIPATLTAGTYYYFCEVGATGGAKAVRSDVATVVVAPKEDKSELPKYILIDENLGDQVDVAILGLDGDGYFFKFQDDNPNIPQRIIIYDGNNENIEMVVNFDKDGLAKNILTEDITIVLGNYVGNRFDAVVITKDGRSQSLENIETDLNWVDYKNSLLSGGMLSSSSTLKSFNFSRGLTAVSLFFNTISCSKKTWQM